MVYRQRNEYDITTPATQVSTIGDTKLYQNEQGALLEVSPPSNSPRIVSFTKGGPLYYPALDESDHQCDATRDNRSPHSCFRANVSNDCRLHWQHYIRALRLTCLFTAFLVSCAFLLRSYDSQHLSRRRQLSALVNSTYTIDSSTLFNESRNQTNATWPRTVVGGNLIRGVPTTSPVKVGSQPTTMPSKQKNISQSTVIPTATGRSSGRQPSATNNESSSSVFDAMVPSLEPTKQDFLATTRAMKNISATVAADSALFSLIRKSGLAYRVRNGWTPQFKAYQWMLSEDAYNKTKDNSQLLQRYALAVLDFSLRSNSSAAAVRNAKQNHCGWRGIICNSGGAVTSIHWPKQHLDGSLPSEIGLLQSLSTLDLGENHIFGSLPKQLYALKNLTSLYIHENRFTGSLPESIGNLYKLVNLYAHNNSFTGTIPTSIGSIHRNMRPLRKLILSYNKLDGTIPSNLKLGRLFYLDLGHNELQGTIPHDWMNISAGTALSNLRHLYLDNNQLSGSLPENFATLGAGRMVQLYLNNNRLTGIVPGGYGFRGLMHHIELQGNRFDSVDKDVCNLAVWVAGEVVNLKGDCSSCDCEYFCRGKGGTGMCYGSNRTNSSGLAIGDIQIVTGDGSQ